MTTEVMPARTVPRILSRKLRTLRRHILRWFVIDGLNRLLLAVLGLIALDLALDWYFRMDHAQRFIMLVLSATVIGYVFWRFLFKPMLAKLTDEALCLEIERRHEGIAEQLISALEFAKSDWSRHPNVARDMVTASIDQGARASEKIDLRQVIRESRFQGNVVLFVLLLFIAGGAGVAIAKNSTMQTWFDRNVLLGDSVWPEDFYFRIEGARGQVLRVPRGDDWPLVATVKEGYRYLPNSAKIEFRTPSGRRIETMNRDADGKVFRYQMMAVTEPMEFRLESHKIRTDWYRISLVNRPEIESVTLTAKPPSYTGVDQIDLPAGQSPYYILRGSSLAVEGGANKPLSAAVLEAGAQTWALSSEGARFSGIISPGELVSGAYTLDVFDEEPMVLPGQSTVSGLGVREPLGFKVRLKDDETPKVKAVLKGVSGMVVSRARLPFSASVSDDFMITSLVGDWDWREDKSEGEDTTGTWTPSSAQLPRGSLLLEEALDLEPLEIPAGSRFNIQFKAADNNVVTGPGEGVSSKLIVRVVSEAELRDDLLRREKDQRQVFAELVDQQDTLLTECQALHAATRTFSELSREQRADVVKFQKRQKLLGNNVKPVIDRFSGMIEEIRNNRLEEGDGVLQRRILMQIIEPMEGLFQNQLPTAADSLELVRRADGPDVRREAFEVAIRNQKLALELMREILLHMVKSEGYQQAVNLLYEIQKSQEDLRKRTDSEKRKLLEKMLRDTDPTAPEENSPPPSQP